MFTDADACACMGPMYGEPHCPCVMRRSGLTEVMELNPLRIDAEKRSAEQWKKLWEPGGYFYENKKNDESKS